MLAPPKKPRKKPAIPPPFDAARPRIETIAEAAVTLRLTETALRARCRRAAANPDANGNAVVADGAHAINIGRHWRIKYV